MNIEEAKKNLKAYLNWEEINGFSKGQNGIAIETLLNELEKKDKVIQEVTNYTNQEIEYYDEDIADYIDDDRNGNKSRIDNLKEDREHWKDILRIIEKVEG